MVGGGTRGGRGKEDILSEAALPQPLATNPQTPAPSSPQAQTPKSRSPRNQPPNTRNSAAAATQHSAAQRKRTFSISASGRSARHCSSSRRTSAAAATPLTTSQLTSNASPLPIISNLMMGTRAVRTSCTLVTSPLAWSAFESALRPEGASCHPVPCFFGGGVQGGVGMGLGGGWVGGRLGGTWLGWVGVGGGAKRG